MARSARMQNRTPLNASERARRVAAYWRAVNRAWDAWHGVTF